MLMLAGRVHRLESLLLLPIMLLLLALVVLEGCIILCVVLRIGCSLSHSLMTFPKLRAISRVHHFQKLLCWLFIAFTRLSLTVVILFEFAIIAASVCSCCPGTRLRHFRRGEAFLSHES